MAAGRVYLVDTAPGAARDLRALKSRPPSKRVLEEIDKAITDLGSDPRPPGAIKLEGGSELYRVVVGEYRVVYDVSDDPPVVTIARVRHRREVYRDI